MDRKSREIGGDLISEGIVLCVYESAFDALLPVQLEYATILAVFSLLERQLVAVHTLLKAVFPGNSRAAQAAAAAREAEAARERARERDEAMRKQTAGVTGLWTLVLGNVCGRGNALLPVQLEYATILADQLPLKKAEYRKDSRVLELYWEKGVPSSAYIPEDADS
jgi:hypothetical protein